MYGLKDYEYVRTIIVKFDEAHGHITKNAAIHMTIIKTGAALISLREFYDMHNKDRRASDVWEQIAEKLHGRGLTIDMVAKIVSVSELALVCSDKSDSAAKSAVLAVSNFVNPFGFDKPAFCRHLTERVHRTIQQSVGGLFFTAIRTWAAIPAELIDPRCFELVLRCKLINKLMRENDSHWDQMPII